MLAAYTYLGLGTVVIEDFQQPDVKLDYYGGTHGTYNGLDRFGRVVDQVWKQYGQNPTTLDEFQYGYDRVGNRLWRENVQSTSRDLDELYAYDEV